MKMYGGVNIPIDSHFHDLSTSLELSASSPGCFIPREKAPVTHSIGGLVGPKFGLDDVVKRKRLTLQELEFRPLGRPAHRQSRWRLRYLYMVTKIFSSLCTFSPSLLQMTKANSCCFQMGAMNGPKMGPYRPIQPRGFSLSQYFILNSELGLKSFSAKNGKFPTRIC
jgi:hypothetical protein